MSIECTKCGESNLCIGCVYAFFIMRTEALSKNISDLENEVLWMMESLDKLTDEYYGVED